MKNLKSKLCSALALILALSMLLPTGVFASQQTPAPIAIKNGDATSTTVDFATGGKQVNLTVSGGAGSGVYTWECYQSDGTTPVTNEDVTFSATNEDTKTFTFKKVGTYKVKAYKQGASADAAWHTVTVNKKFIGIEVVEKDGISKTNYVAGQSFRKSDITVYKKYEGAEREALSSSDYTIDPATLAVDTTSVKVKYDGKEATISNIQVEEKAVKEVQISMPSTVFTAGDSLPELTVKLIMNDGTESTTQNYDYYIDGQKVNVARKLTTADKEITIKVGDKTSNKIIITVNPKSSTPTTINYSAKIIANPDKLEYKVGESFDDTGIVVNIIRNGNENDIYKTLTASDLAFSKTFSAVSSTASASYTYSFTGEDGKSKSVPITVTGIKVTSATPTTYTYTAEMVTAPTTKTYKEGDTFDRTGMTYTIKANGTAITPTGDVIFASYTIKSTDVGKTSIAVKLSFNHNGGTHEVTLTVTGLTITAKTQTLEIYSITSVVMGKTKYPVGYKFTIDDIDYITYKETRTGTTKRLYVYNFDSYDNYKTIEVLDAEGDEKYRYYNEIQETDVQTKSNGAQFVELLVIFEDEDGYDVEYKLEVTVGSSGVSFYDEDDDLVTVYDDIEDALDYTAEQDDDVEDIFELDNVSDRESLTLKLGEDQKVSSSYELELNHNVVIDLNGKSLTFYSDAVEITRLNDDYTLTITNTSSTDAKFIYYDKSITLTVKKGEKLVFEYDEEIPGIYTVEISAGSNGKVTSTPSASNGKITVGHGSDIKFTITPNSEYILDTLKADGKTVAEKDYTISATGVITYTLKGVSKSQKIDVTFKKDDTKKEWNNPFIDVDVDDNYYSAVQFVYENNLFKGTTTTKFAPTGTMTRATFVTVLGRLAGVDVTRYKGSSYIDLEYPRDTEYAPYIEWATQMGIVEGYGDGTFGPSNPITHQQMYVMMYRYTMFVENLPANFYQNISINATDADEVADWALDAVKFASQNNFLVRVNSKITPKSYAKRSELAMLLEVYCDVILGMSEIDER